MQCPSCGFENIPGRSQCAVCSTALSTTSSPSRVYPIRARDRSFWQRIRWRITRSASWTGAGGRVRGILPSWLGIRQAGLLLLSAVPGLGHILVLKEAATGCLLLLGSVAAVILAVLFYNTALADVLAYGVLASSMYSVWATVCRLRGISGSEERHLMLRAGIALIVLAVYFGSYALLRAAASPFVITALVSGRPISGQIAVNDTLLVLPRAELTRGDIVVGTIRYGVPIVGYIIGTPGEHVELRDRIYINGSPTGVAIPPATNGESALPAVTLRSDEYWVMPLTEVMYQGAGQLTEACVIDRLDIWGRAVAVTSPPSHRKRLHRIQVFGR